MRAAEFDGSSTGMPIVKLASAAVRLLHHTLEASASAQVPAENPAAAGGMNWLMAVSCTYPILHLLLLG
ncbi:MAG TPA: hypothetical protein VI776_04680 [Anaerolineales bacterium]|nr:hypothetical protein [Anaerolineales bacterium]